MTTPRTTPQFDTLYKKLNKAQKEAVDTVEGPVMVVAGPGTGKTQILTLRIANILRQTDVDADAILALTFTEAGVAAMRKRLVSIIGEQGYRVRIHTFHGFCNEVIKKYPDEFPRIIGSEPVSDIEQVTILRDIIVESTLEHLKPFGNNFYFLAPIRSKISELKREGLSAQQLRENLTMRKSEVENADDLHHAKGAHKGKMKAAYQDELKRLERGFELADLYDAYEAALTERRLYDYEDMILEALREMQENEPLLRRLQEQHQYILADEHQDANGAQNAILELLSNFHDAPNLFIVGDEKQAIFRFQGASLENFNYFKEIYSDAKLITLEHNYRSGQRILDTAHSLTQGSTHYDAPLKAGGTIQQSVVQVAHFTRAESELLWVAREAQELIAQGVQPSEIAILYRTNADSGPLSTMLESEGVPHRIESNQNVLQDPDIRKLLIVLYAVAEYGSSVRLVPAMHIPFLSLPPTSVYKILRTAREERISVFDALKASKDAKAFINKLKNLAEKAREMPVPEYINHLVRESGFLTYILNSKRAGELVEKLRGLITTITALAARERDYTLSALIEHLNVLQEYNIPISASAPLTEATSSVRLMTTHKSKGLEFDYVFIVGVRDKHWGNTRDNDIFKLPGLGTTKGDNDDERRLFYVALTRARVGVTVSYADTNSEGRAFLPSIFIDELAPEHVTTLDTTMFEAALTADDLFLQTRTAESALQEKDFLNALFIKFGLSVTALNNYLECPWQYFYRNLVRIPEAPSKHLAFGNAVHDALQYFFEHSQRKDALLKAFKESLNKQPLSSGEHGEALARGEEVLTVWYEKYHNTWNPNTKNELEINTHLGETLLRGKLDKLELGEGTSVTVVDYKTGTPKSRNDILGNTKASNGDYYRQLIFYKILLNQHNEEVRRTGKGREYHMHEGVIDFIQPDTRGKLHKESFTITESDTDALKVEIERVSQEIRDLSFWNTRCDKHTHGKCQYCALRDLMR